MKKLCAVMAILLVFTWMPGGVVLGLDRFGPPAPLSEGGTGGDDHPWGGDVPTNGTNESSPRPLPTMYTGYLALDLVMSRLTYMFSSTDSVTWTKCSATKSDVQSSALTDKTYAPVQVTGNKVTIFERRRNHR